MILSTLSLLLLSLLQSTLTRAQSPPRRQVIPAQSAQGPVQATFKSGPSRFDAPYLSAINSSVFEWWWFEAVGADLQSSLTVIFFTTSGGAFPLSGNTDSEVTTVFINALLPNGSTYFTELPASRAVVTSGGALGQAANGKWVGTGMSFTGAPDLSTYTVHLDSEEAGIVGTLNLRSIAPPHYSCSNNLAPGQNLEVFPHIGWSNAQPAARAEGTVKIAGYTLDFTGSALGYHDHNWGDQPFTELIQSWYWGHATMGPYTIVWFDGIDADGKEKVSAYLACDGKILLASCKPGSVVVRPKGKGATYPPKPGKGRFKYWDLEMELGGGKKFTATIDPTSLDLNARPIYSRYLATASGGFVGEYRYDGIAAIEEFTIS